MYSLDFIDNLESVKEKTLEIQKRYISAEQKMANMQKDMTEMIEQLEQIKDRNSQQFKNKFEECEKAEKEYSDVLEMYEKLEEKLETVKEYIKISLKSNKEVYTIFEKILGIQKQKPQVKFEAKTHIYTYIDELGNEIEYDFFEKNLMLSDKFKSENIQPIINMAKEEGLTNKQIRKIDFCIASILQQDNLELFNNYIETIKKCEEIKFIISYDLRTDGIKKEDMLIKKELNKIKKYAIRQKILGIATVIRDESKLMSIMRFLKIYPIIGDKYKNAITEGNVQNSVK